MVTTKANIHSLEEGSIKTCVIQNVISSTGVMQCFRHDSIKGLQDSSPGFNTCLQCFKVIVSFPQNHMAIAMLRKDRQVVFALCPFVHQLFKVTEAL